MTNRLGVAHARLGHHDESVALLRRASQLAPKDAAILANLALAEEEAGQFRDAEIHYRESLALKPENSQASGGLKRVQASSAGSTRQP